MGFTEPDSAPQSPGQMAASGWDIQAPYAPGSPQEIAFPGGGDTVAGSAGDAVTAAQGRCHGDASEIGHVLDLPAGPAEQSKHAGGAGDAYPA